MRKILHSSFGCKNSVQFNSHHTTYKNHLHPIRTQLHRPIRPQFDFIASLFISLMGVRPMLKKEDSAPCKQASLLSRELLFYAQVMFSLRPIRPQFDFIASLFISLTGVRPMLKKEDSAPCKQAYAAESSFLCAGYVFSPSDQTPVRFHRFALHLTDGRPPYA